MNKKIIPITAPTLPDTIKVLKSFNLIIKSHQITNGKYVKQFEERVAKLTGCKYAIALNSCTSGLMLILRSLYKKDGEVILPSFTFHATGHSVLWNGLIPRFVDCDLSTYTIDPEEVRKKINKNTVAIIGVHVFGNPPDIRKLKKVSSVNKIPLIFDSAHGFGAYYQGKQVGSFGLAESFSLSPTKLVTAAEGGIVTTNDEKTADFVRTGRTYGDGGDYDPAFYGLSSRMSEFHAALAIESLKLLSKNVRKRNDLVNYYISKLSKISGLSFQKIENGNQSSYKDFSVYMNSDKFGVSRDELAEILLKEGVVVKKYFSPPLHKIKCFSQFGQGDANLPNTTVLSDGSLSLPLYSHMLKKDIDYICNIVAKVANRPRSRKN